MKVEEQAKLDYIDEIIDKENVRVMDYFPERIHSLVSMKNRSYHD